MKQFFPAMLAVAISLVPAGAFAGEPSAPGPMPPMPMMIMDGDVQMTSQQKQQMAQMMQQSHAQMETIQAQGRSRILGSISPAHRALLAQIVGQLAISPNPDPDAAVRQLNAALSPAEAQAVVSAHSQLEQQMHASMENMHQAFLNMLTPQQRASMTEPEDNDKGEAGGHDKFFMNMNVGGSHGPLTAGDILLHLSQGGHDMMYMTTRMGPPHP